MSLIGTRPPTVDEWEKYELHHRARLAINLVWNDVPRRCCSRERQLVKHIIEILIK